MKAPTNNEENNDRVNQQHKNYTFVIQKLIERPLLYFNRKFDARVWVLLNASDGRVYQFDECYIRLSSTQY